MFIRFSKGAFDESPACRDRKRLYRKGVLIGDSLVMEYGDQIVGVAKLHEETDKSLFYVIVVAGGHALSAETIARSIKDMIGRANKFSETPSQKRRKYYVDVMDCETLPLTASITFKKLQQ